MIKRKYPIMVSSFKVADKQEAMNKIQLIKSEIVNRSIPVSNYTLKYIKYLILNGYTVNTGYVYNGPELIMIDIDNDGDIKPDYLELLSYLEKLEVTPNMIFETSSSTVENPKYRLLFSVEESQKVPNEDIYKILAQNLTQLINDKFPDCADVRCMNTKSIFFPCIKCLYYNENNHISYNDKDLDKLKRQNYKFGLDFKRFITPLFVDLNLYSNSEASYINKIKTIDNMIVATNTPSIVYYYSSILNKKNIRYRIFRASSNAGYNPLDLTETGVTSLRAIQLRPLVLDTDLRNRIKRLNIGLLFHQKENIFFKDIFQRRNESDYIYNAIVTRDINTGFYYYWLYGYKEKKPFLRMDIFDIIEYMTGNPNYNDAVEFVYNICNIKIRPYDKQPYRKRLTEYKKALKNISKWPVLERFFNRTDNLTLYILSFYLDWFYDVSKNFKNISRLQARISYSRIYKYLEAHNVTRKVTDDNIYDAIQRLIDLQFLEKIELADYNSRYLRLNDRLKPKLGGANIVVLRPAVYNPHMFDCISEKLSRTKKQDYNTFTKDIKHPDFFNDLIKCSKELIRNRANNFVTTKDLYNYTAGIYSKKYIKKSISNLVNHYIPILARELNLSLYWADHNLTDCYEFRERIFKTRIKNRMIKVLVLENKDNDDEQFI